MGEIEDILKQIKNNNNNNTHPKGTIDKPKDDYYSKKPIDLGNGIPVNKGTDLDKDNKN